MASGMGMIEPMRGAPGLLLELRLSRLALLLLELTLLLLELTLVLLELAMGFFCLHGCCLGFILGLVQLDCQCFLLPGDDDELN